MEPPGTFEELDQEGKIPEPIMQGYLQGQDIAQQYVITVGTVVVAPEAVGGVAARAEQRALQSMFQDGSPTASDLAKFAEKQGWIKTQTERGPVKYLDKNGVPRMTIKQGSPRAPGSEDPHVELRDRGGQRINPKGEPVSRKSPENHTPIQGDTQSQTQSQSQAGICSPKKGGCGPGGGYEIIP